MDRGEDRGRLIPLREAARRLGVSKTTMARLVKDGRFTIYENPLDKRQKLVDAAELAAAVQPRPVRPAVAGGETGNAPA